MFLVMPLSLGMLFSYEHTYPTIFARFSNNFFFITGRYIVKETAPLSFFEIKTNIFANLVWPYLIFHNPYLATESICPLEMT